jgi:acyl carrier protein/seryl-tRNA synthetase
MLTAPQLEQRLLQFTREQLATPEASHSITADTRLFEDGVIDSLRILELIAFLQSTLGRKVPDAQIVLANFRSIATIARVFTGVESISEKRSSRRRSARRGTGARSAVGELLARRELELTAGGALRMHGAVAGLRDLLDNTVCEWANELGAIGQSFPDEISLKTLDRAGFLSAFPQKLVRAADAARSPAVCYHHYPTLSGCTVDSPGSLVTSLGKCFRNEFDEHAANPAERLREFEMREIITVGEPDLVESLRRHFMERVEVWLKELGLDGFIETATDPFFTEESRGRLLMQQLLPLKYELRLSVDAAGRTIAAASFNNHHDHFGKAFNIRLASGLTASSGCVAFGWERWVIAFVNQHGPDERNWPLSVRKDVAATA